jgi:hypothetical protein
MDVMTATAGETGAQPTTGSSSEPLTSGGRCSSSARGGQASLGASQTRVRHAPLRLLTGGVTSRDYSQAHCLVSASACPRAATRRSRRASSQLVKAEEGRTRATRRSMREMQACPCSHTTNVTRSWHTVVCTL